MMISYGLTKRSDPAMIILILKVYSKSIFFREETDMYSIQEVSRKTGLSTHTLRYYEKEGLIPGVERTQGGFRQYTDEDLEVLGLVCCLKNTGMSLQEIARFIRLTHEGEHTLEERVELLREHRENVIGRMAEMQRYLDKVTWKLNFFSEKLQAYESRMAAENKNG